MKESIFKNVYFKSVVVLTVICLVVSVILGAVNSVTAPIIEENKNNAANGALLVVMPEGKDFKELNISDYVFPSSVIKAYSEGSGGFIFVMSVTGYSSGLEIMCGIASDGKITGATVLSSAETLGAEKTYGDNFKGKTADDAGNVSTVSGATKTTAAYRGAVNDALNAFIVANGGSVDIRTDEEKLRDALALALPEGNGEFEAVFLTDILENVQRVFKAKNGTGFVFSFNKPTEEANYTLIGVNTDKKVSENADSELAEFALKAFDTVSKTVTFTEIDKSLYSDIHKNVISVSAGDNGNYTVSVKGAGFGINGEAEYGASGDYIYIRLSVTPDGTIIDCVTEKQTETDGIGSECGNESYYSQYKGKTSDTYRDVDAIAGATYTSNGYKTAVSRALDAVRIIVSSQNGGN